MRWRFGYASDRWTGGGIVEVEEDVRVGGDTRLVVSLGQTSSTLH